MRVLASTRGSPQLLAPPRRSSSPNQLRPTCQTSVVCQTAAVLAPGKPGLLAKPRMSFVGARGSSLNGVDGMSPDKTQWGDQFEGHLVPPPISKDDTYFKDVVGVEFVDNKEGIVLKELNDLFEKVGFPKRDLAKLKVALENTYYLVWIRAAKQTRYARQGQMIGFGRATSDGALSATIWDVAISPSWQRSGLGRALIERITARLVHDCIPTITLYAEPNVVSLYEKLGFMKDPEGIKGMAFQRSKKEGGAARPRVAAARG